MMGNDAEVKRLGRWLLIDAVATAGVSLIFWGWSLVLNIWRHFDSGVIIFALSFAAALRTFRCCVRPVFYCQGVRPRLRPSLALTGGMAQSVVAVVYLGAGTAFCAMDVKSMTYWIYCWVAGALWAGHAVVYVRTARCWESAMAWPRDPKGDGAGDGGTGGDR